MKKFKTLFFTLLILFSMTATCRVNTALSDQSRVYEYALSALTVHVKSTLEAYPGQTINLSVTAMASSRLVINYTAIELYTFNNLGEDEKFGCLVYVDEDEPSSLLGGESLNETYYSVTVPENASNVVYGKLILLWMEMMGTEESTTYERKSTFIITYLKNVELETLRSRVSELERENGELKKNITEINKTLTDIKNRYEDELSGTRSIITILAVTTVFFVATTAYLFLRRPKEYW